MVSEPQAPTRRAAQHLLTRQWRFPIRIPYSEMQASLLATASAQPICTTRGISLGRRCNAGFNSLLQDRKQKAMAHPSSCRQQYVHTRAANPSSSSVNSTNTRTQEGSAPALAAANRSSHAQPDSQPQEGMFNSVLVHCHMPPLVTVLTLPLLVSSVVHLTNFKTGHSYFRQIYVSCE